MPGWFRNFSDFHSNNRRASYLQRGVAERLRARIFASACGYDGAGDRDWLRSDPAFSPFNAHSDVRCFQPLHLYDTITGRPVALLLRPSKTSSGREIVGHLWRLFRRIRRHWPARVTLHRDSYYGRPEVMDFCDNRGTTSSSARKTANQVGASKSAIPCSWALAGFGNAAYTLVRGDVISSSCD